MGNDCLGDVLFTRVTDLLRRTPATSHLILGLLLDFSELYLPSYDGRVLDICRPCTATAVSGGRYMTLPVKEKKKQREE